MRRRTALGVAVAAVTAGAARLMAAQDAPGGQGRAGAGGPPVENKPLPKNDAEKKILAVLDDMFQNQRRGMMNVPPDDGRLLRLLVEFAGAKHTVEIGASNGYSGLWTCLGLAATGGKLTTHEIDGPRAALARENFKRAGVEKIATLVEGDAHKELAKLEGPVDMVFIDADKEGYTDYLKQLLPKLRPGGLILAHNVTSHAQALADYFKAITANPELETVFVNPQAAGISLTLKKR
jgi:predicted O-methyltransferase YrrM